MSFIVKILKCRWDILFAFLCGCQFMRQARVSLIPQLYMKQQLDTLQHKETETTKEPMSWEIRVHKYSLNFYSCLYVCLVPIVRVHQTDTKLWECMYIKIPRHKLPSCEFWGGKDVRHKETMLIVDVEDTSRTFCQIRVSSFSNSLTLFQINSVRWWMGPMPNVYIVLT